MGVRDDGKASSLTFNRVCECGYCWNRPNGWQIDILKSSPYRRKDRFVLTRNDARRTIVVHSSGWAGLVEQYNESHQLCPRKLMTKPSVLGLRVRRLTLSPL